MASKRPASSNSMLERYNADMNFDFQVRWCRFPCLAESQRNAAVACLADIDIICRKQSTVSGKNMSASLTKECSDSQVLP